MANFEIEPLCVVRLLPRVGSTTPNSEAAGLSSGDASSPSGDSGALCSGFSGSGLIAATTGDEGVAGTFLRRGVAATLKPASEFG